MTAYNVVSAASLQAGQPEDISIILANLQAIASVINGGIDNGNISPAAAIDKTKLAPLSIVDADVSGAAAIAVAKLAAGTNGYGLQTVAGVPTWVAPPTSHIIDRVATDLDVTNTVTETPIYSFSVPGGTLGANKCLRLTMMGEYQTLGAQPFSLRFKYGATTLSTVTAQGANVNNSVKGWRCHYELFADGATNAQAVVGRANGGEAEQSANHGSFEHTEELSFNMYGTSAIDSTVAQNLVITAQWANANASLHWKIKHAYLELI